MKLTNENIVHLAKLSRISLIESEIDSYREKISSVLSYVDQLQELDTSDVSELQHSGSLQNIFREDLIVENADQSEKARNLFSQKEGEELSVQSIFSE